MLYTTFVIVLVAVGQAACDAILSSGTSSNSGQQITHRSNEVEDSKRDGKCKLKDFDTRNMKCHDFNTHYNYCGILQF